MIKNKIQSHRTNNHNKLHTCLAIALLFSLLLSSFSSYGITSAQEAKNSTSELTVANDALISAEDTSKRGEFEKHYLLSDGSFIAVSYPEAIHYLSEDGKWEEVDNRLSRDSQSLRIVNQNKDFSVSFAGSPCGNSLATLMHGGKAFTWGLSVERLENGKMTQLSTFSTKKAEIFGDKIATRAGDQAVSSVSAIGKKVNDAEAFANDKLSGKLGYSRLFDDAPELSVEYSVFHNKIEEDIFINAPTDLRAFTMNIQVDGLAARLNADGSVDFLDKNGEMQYHIGVPYMEDANNEVLNDIEVTVDQNGNNCVVTYTPNAEWLTSDERAYPILLDPSITTKEYNSNITDTYVCQGDTSNHSSEQRLYYGVKSGKVNRTYIKINNLPKIDASMPVLGATMQLKFLSGTTTGKTAQVYKASGAWDASSITYANQPSILASNLLSTCDYNSSVSSLTFDLTHDVTALYDEFNAAMNYGYVVKYADESTTDPDYNVFYSTEATSASKRPVITVTYGYALPSSLTNGGIYSFQNYGSMSYMTVHNGSDANGVNVYQQHVSSPSNLGAQHKFKLEYVESTGGYYLRSMASSNGTNRVLDIVKSGGYVNDGGNVQIYAPNDALAQHWFIIGTSYVTFKIVPRTNMSLALTAYSDDDGSSAGTTTTSAGNIFVSTYDDSTNYQNWAIWDEDGNLITYSSQGTANGTYYLNNTNYGKYLHKSGTTAVNAVSGLISTYEDTIRWKITHVGNDQYTIQSSDDLTKYLYSGSSTSVALTTMSSVTDNYLWTINTASGGGVWVRNVATQGYLKQTGTSTVSCASTLGTPETSEHKKCSWGLVSTDNYSNDGNGYYRELPSGYQFKTLYMFAGNEKNPELHDEYSDVLWGAPKHFTYSGYNTSYVTLNSETGTFTASNVSSCCSTTVVATHKVTGLSSTFALVINPTASLVGVSAAGHDHLSALQTVASNIRACGYSDANVYAGAFSTSAIDTYLDTNTNNVFVSRSHGGIVKNQFGVQIGTCIQLNADPNNPICYQSNGSINNLDLTNMKLIMFIACVTGAGRKDGLNLPKIAVNQGAKTAVGFEESIDCNDANNWTKEFFELMEDGMSVGAACLQLKENRYAETGLATYIICGHEHTSLN